MVVLQKADTNLDEVVNDVNNLVNCTHCHGLFFFFFASFLCVCVPSFFFFVLYFRYMNERERERNCNGWMQVNE